MLSITFFLYLIFLYLATVLISAHLSLARAILGKKQGEEAQIIDDKGEGLSKVKILKIRH